jgi:hypothetical protein
MVSKSYVVNECPTLTDDDHKSVQNEKLETSSKQQMSKIDRYILHISNEMVSGECSTLRTLLLSSRPVLLADV